MNRAARWAGALLALVAATAHAQGAGTRSGAAGTPDVPGGEATLRGQIVHASRPEADAGLPVLLYALPDSGAAGPARGRLRRARPLRLRERLERSGHRLSGRRARG